MAQGATGMKDHDAIEALAKATLAFPGAADEDTIGKLAGACLGLLGEANEAERLRARLDSICALLAAGWRVQTDCGPTVQLIQDRYDPHQVTRWHYPDEIGESRYAPESMFASVATRMVIHAFGTHLSEQQEED
jgi:hypothetical protein